MFLTVIEIWRVVLHVSVECVCQHEVISRSECCQRSSEELGGFVNAEQTESPASV